MGERGKSWRRPDTLSITPINIFKVGNQAGGRSKRLRTRSLEKELPLIYHTTPVAMVMATREQQYDVIKNGYGQPGGSDG